MNASQNTGLHPLGRHRPTIETLKRLLTHDPARGRAQRLDRDCALSVTVRGRATVNVTGTGLILIATPTGQAFHHPT